MNLRTTSLTVSGHSSTTDPDQWIRDGRAMAEKEGDGVFDSIERIHDAERAAVEAFIAGRKALGAKLVEEYQRIQARLAELGFDAARYLREIARGQIDLWWAIGLTILNGVLAALVLMFGGGSPWMTGLLALLVLTSALPIEEFFTAYEEKATFREGVFILISVLAIGASFWLGTLRGLFILRANPDDIGPATEALRMAGMVLRYALGVLSIASEVLCGYKWYSVRHRLYSSLARAKTKSDSIRADIVTIQADMKVAEAEPGIRRDYRTVGARQYLAKLTCGESPHAHLQRAVIGAAIAILVVLGLLLFASVASAQGPASEAVPKVVMVDLTKSSSPDDFALNVEGASRVINTAVNNERVVVIGISDAFGRPRILQDRTVRGTGSFGLELQASREAAVADWRKIASGIMPNYDNTSVIGTIQLLPYMLDRAFDLYIFSDGRESVLANIEKVEEINVKRVMGNLQRKGAIPSLPAGTRVYMFGVTPNGKTDAYMKSLRAFWSAYLEATGARLEAFRLDRNLLSGAMP